MAVIDACTRALLRLQTFLEGFPGLTSRSIAEISRYVGEHFKPKIRAKKC